MNRLNEITSPNNRIIGLDFARGLAVWGMLLMNFKIVMTSDTSGVLGTVTHFMEGHFGVMFVVLAGIGISLFMKRAISDGDKIALNRKKTVLIKRSIFLIIIGLLFCFIWPADILHFYGFYILLALFVVDLSTSKLWVLISLSTLTFPLFLLVIPYEEAWNFTTLQYADFWSIKGFLRNTFYNGFHPVFPWIAFLFLGIIFGRVEYTKVNLKKYLFISLLISIVAELLSYFLVKYIPGELSFLFLRDAMPPTPLFVIASGAEAIVMITLSILLSDVLKESKIVQPLVYTGQMVLSQYIFHVFIGMGILDVIGRMQGQTLNFALLYSTAYFFLSVITSHLWGSRFKRGPVEILMRKITG